MSPKIVNLKKNKRYHVYRSWSINVFFIISLVAAFGWFQYQQAKEQLITQIQDALHERSHSIELFCQSFVSKLFVLKHSLEIKENDKLDIIQLDRFRSSLTYSDPNYFVSSKQSTSIGNVLIRDISSSKKVEEAAKLFSLMPIFEGIYQSNSFIRTVSYHSLENDLKLLYSHDEESSSSLMGDESNSSKLINILHDHNNGLLKSNLIRDGYLWTEFGNNEMEGAVVACIVPVIIDSQISGIILLEVGVDCLREQVTPIMFKYGKLQLEVFEPEGASKDSFSHGGHSRLGEHSHFQVGLIDGEWCFDQSINHSDWLLCYRLTRYEFFAQKFTLLQTGVFLVSILLTLFIIGYFYLSRSLIARELKTEKAELETQLKSTELRVLRSQINPHFLFNSLNSIRSLIADDIEKARWAVTQLSSFLRSALKTSDLYTIPLEKELDCVNAYLAMEKIRFEERIQFSSSCDPKLYSLPVPPMIIQGIIENAVKHGVAKRKDPTHIDLAISLENHILSIKVINDGIFNNDKSSTSIGKKNIVGRLKIMYGENSGFTILESNAKVIASIKIPLNKLKKYYE